MGTRVNFMSSRFNSKLAGAHPARGLLSLKQRPAARVVAASHKYRHAGQRPGESRPAGMAVVGKSGGNDVSRGPEKEKNFWEELLAGFGKGVEIASNLLPFFGHGRTRGAASVSSASGGWIGNVKPTVVRGTGFPKIRQKGEGVVEITHQGQLTQLLKVDDGGEDYARGDTMYSIAINPEIEEWLGEVDKYEKFRFLDVAVTYIPAVTTECSGKLVGFFESDIDNPTMGGEGEESIRRAMSNNTAAQVDVWVNHTWVKSFKGEDASKWYYVGASYHEARLAYQGRFSLMAGSDMTDANLPTSLGDLIVTYRVEFTVPNLNNGDVGGQSVEYYSSGGGVPNGPFPGLTACDIYDVAVDPDYQIPHYFDVNSINDCTFYPTPGYYLVAFRLYGAGANMGTVVQTLGGGTREIYWGPTKANTWSSCVVGSTDACAYSALCFPEGGYITITYTTADQKEGSPKPTSLSSSYITFTCLGGALPYISESESIRSIVSSGKRKLKYVSREVRAKSSIHSPKRSLRIKKFDEKPVASSSTSAPVTTAKVPDPGDLVMLSGRTYFVQGPTGGSSTGWPSNTVTLVATPSTTTVPPPTMAPLPVNPPSLTPKIVH